MLRFLAIFLLLLLSGSAAQAQNFGNIPPRTVLGNQDPATNRPASPMDLSLIQGATDPRQFGAVPAKYAYNTVTTAAAGAAVTLAGATMTAANVGDYITILGAGPYEGRYVGQIATVTDATHVTVNPAPTLAMTAFSTIVYNGKGNAAAINAAIAAANAAKMPVVFSPGIYMVEAPVQCNVINYNNANLAPPGCVGITGGGTTLMAVTDMAASTPDTGTVFTVGGYANASDYTQYIRDATLNGNGLTIDCNFRAKHGFGLPFSTEINLTAYTVKNCLVSAFHAGSPGSPAASSGLHFHHNRVARDSFAIPITAMTCSGGKPLLTTAIDHGIVTGRVVAVIGAANMPGSAGNPPAGEGPINFIWDNAAPASGPRQGVLHGVDCTSWPAYNPAPTPASLYLNLPSATILHRVTAVSAAAAAVVTVSPGNLPAAAGQTWCFYGIGGNTTPYVTQKNAPDGCYTLSSVAGAGPDGPFQLTIPFNTTGFTYVGGGTAFRKLPNTGIADLGLYLDNTTDVEALQNFVSGVQYALYANPTNAGFDGKYTHNHVNNFTFHGLMLAGHYLGGHNTLLGEECDGLMVFCGQFFASGNSSHGSAYNGGAYSTQMDNAFWMWRLEPCTGSYCATYNGTSDITVAGDKYFGRSATLRINEMSNHALAGNPAWYASIPNYKSFGVQPGANVLYSMPDSALGTTKTIATPAYNGTGITSTSGVYMGFGSSCQFTPMYKTSVFVSISGDLTNATAANGALGNIYVGSGTPPARGTALGGGTTQIGQMSGVSAVPAGGSIFPFSWQGPVTGLTLGTTYWFDVVLKAFPAGTANANDTTCTAMEQ